MFFAVDDVIVTSVNTYSSMMGISTEDKYLMKSLWENKKYPIIDVWVLTDVTIKSSIAKKV